VLEVNLFNQVIIDLYDLTKLKKKCLFAQIFISKFLNETTLRE